MNEIQETSAAVVREASKVIIGKEKQIELILTAIFCGGHVLLDDLPGVGKTTLVKVMARILGCSFARVQFTPDLLPSDITGMNVFDQKTGDFRILHGPVMTNLFLADEINRAIPRTQSALLEAMEELQVTIDGTPWPLPRPFIVMATQNPVEMESTFRLPAAQMDRFLLRLSLGYPSHDDEIGMLKAVGDEIPFDALSPLLHAGEIAEIQQRIAAVHVNDKVLDYIVTVVEATRSGGLLTLPAGPRGSRALYRAGKAFAAIRGRNFVTPGDVKTLAPHILPHRVAAGSEARLLNKDAAEIVADILDKTAVPDDEEAMLHAT
ncbi:MAG: MoxR family ATPase [Clostridiales Family XIII bacterium]|jgi:MoxR-like ATPase|nr:MoxR family ATPase [Clostridiales Family XIII bacterium]